MIYIFTLNPWRALGLDPCTPFFFSVITLQVISSGPIILNVIYMFLSPSSNFPPELLIHISNQLLDNFMWMSSKHLKIMMYKQTLHSSQTCFSPSKVGTPFLRPHKLVSSLTRVFVSLLASNLTAHNVASTFKNTANLIPFQHVYLHHHSPSQQHYIHRLL